jgi:hypothetical protein
MAKLGLLYTILFYALATDSHYYDCSPRSQTPSEEIPGWMGPGPFHNKKDGRERIRLWRKGRKEVGILMHR